MIDLSYLTEQEQEMIKAVLKRDAALKRVEEERVKKLQRSLRDRSKLKYFTGEWFYETKSRRHRDRIHGSDIIRASLSQKKPITLLELTQMWEERPSFVNSGNKEVFVPAELSGLLEEPAAQPLEAREHRGRNRLVSEVQPEQQKPAVPVTEKRHNPFNEAQVAPMAAVQTDGLLTNGAVQMVPTSEGEFLLPPKNNVVSDTVINSEGSPALCGTFSEPVAEPKKRTVIHTDLDSPRSDRSCAELHSKTSSPRGFLKHSSSDSSSDMTNPRHDSPSLPHSPSPVTMLTSSGDLGAGAMFTRQTESVSSPDSEQVGFSWVATSGSKEEVELQRACEPGEHYLLDVGNPTLSSFEQKSSHIDTCSPLREGSNDMIHSRVVHEELVKAEDLSLTAARTPANPSSYPSVWTAMVPPCGGTVLHTSQSQNHEHVHHVESHVSQVSGLHTSMNEKGDGENSDPGKTTLKQIPSRPMSTSKSLEDIKSLLTLSTAPATPSSSFSDPDQMKRMSMSVPVFVQEENGGRDSDSESSGRSDGQRRTGSSFTNLSASSGVPSVSSQVSGSVMSIYSGDFGSVDVKGTIQFAISYVQKLSEMHIFVVQCRNLAIADIRKNRSDPYVKCYLFPDKAKLGKRKTSVKKKTVNPTYNEILRYRVDIETLRTQTMNLSVWHNDTFGRNSFMGEVDMDLSKWDFSNTQMRDYTLKPRTASGMQPVDYRGEMRVALRFLNQVSQSKQSSKTGEVQIWVKDCKNLPMIRGAAIDPFVKCTVLPDPNKKSRQKTRVLKRTADPQFNHTMVHEGFGPEDLKEACVELTVWDHDRLSNHFIGGLRLGLGTGKSYGAPVDWMDCSSDEAALWERMMDCHNEWVEDVLPLRMLVMARSMSK
ncbi:synaptotagmin-like protein 2 isoform X5 [Scleropages formosus]|uniref:synaptotagmin-like protein 2 isoform X5 n=1 Tax=Scleropages formosus TaxID=113540 RepID=UPI0010FA98DC|nr:synaptotagmin-like protein 2 isoform X5 [Scleropages formosus]